MFPLSLYFAGASVRWNQRQLWANISASYCANETALTEQLRGLCSGTSNATLTQVSQWQEYLEADIQNQCKACLSAHTHLSLAESLTITALAEQLLSIPDTDTRERILHNSLQTDYWHNNPFSENLLIHSALWQQAVRQGQLTTQDSPTSLMTELIKRLGHTSLQQITTHTCAALTRLSQPALSMTDAVELASQLPVLSACTLSLALDEAMTAQQAKQHFSAYLTQIELAGRLVSQGMCITLVINPGALHPAFTACTRAALVDELSERLLHLLQIADSLNVAIMLAEVRSHQVETLLRVFRQITAPDARVQNQDETGDRWLAPGLTLPAYLKRALPVLGWLNGLAEQHQCRIPVRLVEGEFQQDALADAWRRKLPDYPALTQPAAVELSYQVCADYLLGSGCNNLLPQLVCQQPLTLARLPEQSRDADKPVMIALTPTAARRDRQATGTESASHVQKCLDVVITPQPDTDTRQTAGQIRQSVLNRFFTCLINMHSKTQTKDALLLAGEAHTAVKSGQSSALEMPVSVLPHSPDVRFWLDQIAQFDQHQWTAAPLINGESITDSPPAECFSPYDKHQHIGLTHSSTAETIREAYGVAYSAWPSWQQTDLAQRCSVINRFAALLELHAAELISLCIRETGFTLTQALSEVRQTISICQQYSAEAPQTLAPSGRDSEGLQTGYQGQGVFICISSAQSPLRISVTQIIAALLSGNTVIAKPDSHAALIIFRVTELVLEAGLPSNVISVIPGQHSEVGPALLGDYRLGGLACHGASRTAHIIGQQRLLNDQALLTPFVATRSCLRVAITDLTQSAPAIAQWAIHAAFRSPGPGNSLQVLCLPESMIDAVTDLLIAQLPLLNQASVDNADGDLGAVNDYAALEAFHGHLEAYREEGLLRYERPEQASASEGYFAMPALIRLNSLTQLSQTCDGPLLHLLSYSTDTLPRVMDELNRTGIPLSLEIISRDAQLTDTLSRGVRVTNRSINPTAQISAQGRYLAVTTTGPKLGSPGYLMNFVRQIENNAGANR